MTNKLKLKTLRLQAFRPFEEAEFCFGPHLNVICGPNARGKTTLLEAIYLLMSGQSFRATRISDLMRSGSSHFYVETFYQKLGVDHRLQIIWSDKDRRVVDNSTVYSGLGGLPGILPGVSMTPEDIEIVKGAPQVRREFLDIQIAQVDPLYMHHLYRYQRAVRQRNALLKIRQALTIESWEYEMANAAAYLMQKRAIAISDLKPLAQEYYTFFAGTAETFDIDYQTLDVDLSSLTSIKDRLVAEYRKLRKKEMELGSTLTGPHRDEVLLKINGREARFFASEGQKRTCVVALRCAQWKLISQQLDEAPLMLVDDLGQGLDASRQGRLLNYLLGLNQVFITSTDRALPINQNFHRIEL